MEVNSPNRNKYMESFKYSVVISRDYPDTIWREINGWCSTNLIGDVHLGDWNTLIFNNSKDAIMCRLKFL